MKKPSDLQRTSEAINRSTAIMLKPYLLQSLFTEASDSPNSIFKLIQNIFQTQAQLLPQQPKLKGREIRKPMKLSIGNYERKPRTLRPLNQKSPITSQLQKPALKPQNSCIRIHIE